jgi:hypothetical protein
MLRNRRGAWSLMAAMILVAGGPAAAGGATGGSSAGSDRIVSIDVANFPSVLITLSLPGTSELKVDDVTVTENGATLAQGGRHGVIVKSLAVSNGEYQSVVFAIDNSDQVSATELRSFISAAHSFVSAVPSTVPFGVVTLASKSKVIQSVSFSDQAQTQQALDSIGSSSGGSSLDEGLVAAMKATASRGQRNIVVLASAATARQAISSKTDRAIDRSGARVFAIVLGNAGSRLATTSNRTGGIVDSASAQSLSTVTNALAHEIGDQYLLSYQSHAAAGQRLDISVAVNNQTLHTSAIAPAAAHGAVTPSPSGGLFRGTHGFVLIIALIVLFVVLTSIPGRLRDRRKRKNAAEQRNPAPSEETRHP